MSVRIVKSMVMVAMLLGSCDGSARQPRVLAEATTTANPCGSWASSADTDGRLIGATRDSTKIRVAVSAPVRAGTEVRLDWHMTAGPGALPLTMYVERAELSEPFVRVPPRAIEPSASADDYAVYITFPDAGCWRMHGERVGGKLSGDVWLPVLLAIP
jgi:hypothetical protein